MEFGDVPEEAKALEQLPLFVGRLAAEGVPIERQAIHDAVDSLVNHRL
jgi:hypothetical protein